MRYPAVNSPSPQALKAVIYADSEGSPGELLATGTEVTTAATSTALGGLICRSPRPSHSPQAPTGSASSTAANRGIGYAYDEVSNSRAYNENTFSSGPRAPSDRRPKTNEQASIYATYTLSSAPPIPRRDDHRHRAARHTLTEHHGSWTHEPTSYSYQWETVHSLGEGCLQIAGATSQTYVPVAGDAATRSESKRRPRTRAAPGAPPLPRPPLSNPRLPPTPRHHAHRSRRTGPDADRAPWLVDQRTDELRYQWRQCDSAGNSCTDIAGATSQTYVRLLATSANAPRAGDGQQLRRLERTRHVWRERGRAGDVRQTGRRRQHRLRDVRQLQDRPHHHAVGCGVDQQAELVCDTRRQLAEPQALKP